MTNNAVEHAQGSPVLEVNIFRNLVNFTLFRNPCNRPPLGVDKISQLINLCKVNTSSHYSTVPTFLQTSTTTRNGDKAKSRPKRKVAGPISE